MKPPYIDIHITFDDQELNEDDIIKIAKKYNGCKLGSGYDFVLLLRDYGFGFKDFKNAVSFYKRVQKNKYIKEILGYFIM